MKPGPALRDVEPGPERHCAALEPEPQTDAALARRFQPVFVSEPTVEDTVSILRGIKEKYEAHHGVRITDAALVGSQAGTTLMVTRYGLNGLKEIEAAKRRLEQNGLLVKGVIFNAVVRKASTYGEYGYYQYEYASTNK